MTFRALDHSSRLADPAGFAKAAKAAGFAAVLRYLPLPPGTLQSDNVGRLTAEEVAAYHAAGLGIGIVWETTQYRPIMGAAGGSVDGFQARAAANALGFPPKHPIFGAVDFPPTPGQLPLVTAYLQTAGFEPYANGPTLTHLQARHSWMHNWGGSDFADPHIHQQGGQVTIAGVACDLNDCYHDDCIWWPPNPQPVPQPSQPVEEDDMLGFTNDKGTFRCDSSGAVYTFDSHGAAVDGGRYLGGLNSHPDWHAGAGQPNGPPFAFGPTPEGGYFITTRDAQGGFHPYVFPPDGSLK
jgi:hypothetical protein